VDKFGAALIIGLVFGSAYALLALGIVLVYKGSRVFNFAQGEFGTVAAFVVYILSVDGNLPTPLGIIAGLLAAVAMGLVVERLIVQPLFSAPRVTLLVATAAVSLGSVSLQIFLGDAQSRFFPPQVSGTARQLFGTAVTWQQLLAILALGTLALLLYLFFSRTQLGLAVLAASQEPTATNLVGISVRRISALLWGVAALLGGVAGVLVAGLAGSTFTPGYVTSQFLIFGFVAGVVGGMTSLPGAVVGGLLLGLVQAFTNEYIATIDAVQRNVPGTAQIALFLLLVIVLAVRPSGLLGKEA
jgi:branched-chain amino acid transport system permease protein